MAAQTRNERPWYRHCWLWFVLAPPLASVVLSAVLIVLSAQHSDSMVVDDYAKVGTAMHRYMAKEAHAAALGVEARLYVDSDGASALLQGLDNPPERLFLLLSHPTQANLDTEFELVRNAAGIYQAKQHGWQPGRWYVRLEPEDRQWRLTGQLGDGSQELSMPSSASAN